MFDADTGDLRVGYRRNLRTFCRAVHGDLTGGAGIRVVFAVRVMANTVKGWNKHPKRE